MTHQNQYLTWATQAGANVLGPADYAALVKRAAGYQAGKLDSVALNTPIRQASVIASAIAQFTADWGPNDVLDDGNVATFEANFIAAMGAIDSQGMVLYLDTGTVDAAAIAIPGLAAYPASANVLGFWFRKLGTNLTTTPSLNINGLGAKTFVKNGGGALGVGDLITGCRYYVEYDGTSMRVVASGYMPSDATAAINAQVPALITAQVPGIITTNVPPIIASQVPPYLRGYLGGFTTSNDIGTPTTLLDISAGAACSDDSSMIITAPSGMIKSISATWSGGVAGGLDTGTIAASTWYYIYVLGNPTNGGVDSLISLSPTSPTMTLPNAAGFTKKRRIGSIFVNASSQIRAFTQNGNEFLWQVPDLTINGGSIATTAASYTALVPSGIRVNALLSGKIVAPASNTGVLFSSLDTTDTTPAFGGISTLAMVASSAGSFQIGIRTNASGQYRVRADQTITGTFFATTVGWIDTRGAF